MTFRVQKLAFTSGSAADPTSKLTLDAGQITIFIGPNNGGKSRAIFEIRHSLTHENFIENAVLEEVEYREITTDELESKRAKFEIAKIEGDNASEEYVAFNLDGEKTLIHWPSMKHGINISDKTNVNRRELYRTLLQPFISNLNGLNRLTLTDPKAGQRRGQLAKTTIGRLFSSSALIQKVRKIVFKAFGRFLVIDPTEMTMISYALSNDEPPENVELSLDDTSQKFFESTQPLSVSSDGTKAFVGIIAEFIAGDREVFLIDEPEAFLHPSLAAILGQEISSSLEASSQLFAATHSAEFLLGCIATGKQIDVVRLTYDGVKSTAQLLAKDQLKRLSNDPLLRSADVVSGLFHNGAVVVEADGDRAFYGEIFHRLVTNEDLEARHIRFMNAQNKQTMPSISSFLRGMGVPAAMIFDLDWIKEDGDVCAKYFRGGGIPAGLWDGFRMQRATVRRSLEAVDPNYKRNGGVNVLGGSDRAAADAFLDSMEEYGIFTVRTGELESWLSALGVSTNKTGWVSRIFDAMGSDPAAPIYVKPSDADVWEFLRKIVNWISNGSRKGI